MSQFAKKLRGILEKAGKLESGAGEALLAEAQSQNRPFTEVLVKEGVASEQELIALIARAANIPPIDLQKLAANKEVLESVPEDVAREYNIYPIDRIGTILTIAVANPFDVLKFDDIRIITGCQLRAVISTAEEIEKAIGKGYQVESESVDGILDSFDSSDVELKEAELEDDTTDLSSISDEDAPVVKLVNKMILDGCNTGVSDIHIEPFEKKVLVRYRKDGCLFEAMTLPKRMQNTITSRIKIMAKMDIAERRKPQDGKFQMKLRGASSIDFRTVDPSGRSVERRPCIRILDCGQHRRSKIGTAWATRPRALSDIKNGDLQAALWNDARDRSHGIGQVDHAVLLQCRRLRAARDQRGHGRGSGRVPDARGHQSGGGQSQGEA